MLPGKRTCEEPAWTLQRIFHRILKAERGVARGRQQGGAVCGTREVSRMGLRDGELPEGRAFGTWRLAARVEACSRRPSSSARSVQTLFSWLGVLVGILGGCSHPELLRAHRWLSAQGDAPSALGIWVITMLSVTKSQWKPKEIR